MKVLIRADSSVEIGAGHVSRCAALAHSLYERGVRAALLTRDLPGAIARATPALDVIAVPDGPAWSTRAAEFSRTWLAPDDAQDDAPAWLIVDHYDLDAEWEREARAAASRVLVIDDLANRPHACDVLVDQNLSGDTTDRYTGLVPADCSLLLGPKYALLRPEFARARANARRRDGRVERVLVFFGGSDAPDLTTRALDAIAAQGGRGIAFDVVVGAGNPRREALALAASAIPHVTFHCQTESMAGLMAAADLGIGAGGTATWERCCVGLPSLVAITAENQRRVVVDAASLGACANLGDASRITPATLATALDDAVSGRLDLRAMSAAAWTLTDGRGADRVADALVAM